MFSSTTKNMEPSNVGNIIGKGTYLDGSITTVGNLRVEGKITGGIKVKAKIVLSNTSFVQGSIVAHNAEIGGEVEGAVEALELLILKPTAVVHGDIIARKLVFEEGAKFNGKCKMGDIKKMPLSENESPPPNNTNNDKKKLESGFFKNQKK